MDLLRHPPTATELRERLELWAGSPVTYDRASVHLDPRFRYHRWGTTIATDTQLQDGSVAHPASTTWPAARRALEQWAGHRYAGVAIHPVNAPLAEGQVVALVLRLAPLPVWTVAGCQILQVSDAEDRFGFTYGTLPGHPERGEERFTLFRAPSGAVTFQIEVWSRPAAVLTRMAGPVGGLMQAHISRRYLEGVRRAACFT